MYSPDSRSHAEAERVRELAKLYDSHALLSGLDSTHVCPRPVRLGRQFGLRQFGPLALFFQKPPHGLVPRRLDIPAHFHRPQLSRYFELDLNRYFYTGGLLTRPFAKRIAAKSSGRTTTLPGSWR